MDGMTWYIVPMELGKRNGSVAVDHRMAGGPLVVEERSYRSYNDAMNAVMKQKSIRDRAVLRKIISG